MKKKLIIFILFIFSIILINGNKIYKSISRSINNKDYKLSLSELRAKNYNKMKIETINIKNRNTGTAPFNDGNVSNSDGVDVTESDDYVRTFDYVKYIMELGISPNTDEGDVDDSSVFSGGVIKVKAKLPNQGSKILMTWEEDAWMKNVSYNDDKTEIYAEYFVPSNVDIAHANQTLSFTFKVNGYKSEVTENMAPEFEVWMEGNKPDNDDSTVSSVIYKDTKNRLIISGKPSYDVDLQPSTYLYPGKKEDVVGQYISYGVGISLIQPYSYINDLRGVEFPSGKFEVELNNIYLARKHDSNENYSKVTSVNTNLLAYSVNAVNNNLYYPTQKVYTRNLPKGSGGGVNGVSNSGTMIADFNSNVTTISFENYELNNKYPIRNIVAPIDTITYPDNIGYFASGNVQLFVPFYDNESTYAYDYSYEVKVDKIKYYDSMGHEYVISGNDELKKNNNSTSIYFKKTNNGSFWVSSNLKSNNTEARDGLASASLGAYINPQFTLMPVTGPYDSAERLIVWNTNYFELSKKSVNEWVNIGCHSELGFECNGKNNFEVKYGIYKSNINGTDTDELVNSAYFDDFNWYNTPEEALKYGKISAIYGIDNEVLGNRIHRLINPQFRIIENNELIGKVGIIVHRTRVYDLNKNIVYEPYKKNSYIKTAYDSNGNLVRNHSNNNIGLSVLILGNKTGVTTTVTDKDFNNKLKTTYDVTDGDINVKVIPTLTDSNSDSVIERYSELVSVETVLPKGLNYKNNSANKEPEEVVVNSDGTTTIRWKYTNWKINSSAPEYPEITFKAEISSSVNNNSSLSINSTIFEERDLRDIRYRNSSYTVFISNLSGSKALKEINNSTLDVNESFNIVNTIGNISKTNLSNVMAFEELPKDNYNGSYKIKVKNLNDNQKLYYTNKKISELNIEEDINGKKNIKEFDESLWNEVSEGEEIPESATALFIIIDNIDSSDNISFEYEVIPNNNKIGDIYSFSMNIISSNLITAVKTNTVVAQVVERKISGVAYIDINENEKLDTEDELLKNIDVSLLNSDKTILKTSKTNDNGEYLFDGLCKGNYYIKFNIPEGYKTIKIDDNKVNSNGLTNLIEHTADRDIANVNFGIERRKVKVITHHYYGNMSNSTTTMGLRNRNNSISSDVEDNYLYGEQYTTSVASDIPKNYVVLNTPNNSTGIANNDIIEVNYYYGMKDSVINDSISNTCTEVISDMNDLLEYKIDYNVKITDYIGNVSIVIVDTLPYDIDLDLSDLNGGVYNSENKTITWYETVNNINTYEDEFNRIFEKNIKIKYKNIILTNFVINNNASVSINLSNNTNSQQVVFNTAIEIPSTIKEYYYLKGTDEELIPSLTSEGIVGQKFSANNKVIKGYNLVEVDNKVYTFSENEQIIIHEYIKQVSNPNTNDNINKYLIIFVSCFTFVLGSLIIRKKRNS